MMTMMLCSGLEAGEQEKVERLDNPISEAFHRAGHVVRICQGRVEDEERVLDFCGPKGVIASVPADEFMAASDAEAVAIVARS
jgi:hypothetical protein